MLLFLAVTLRMGQRVMRATPITRLDVAARAPGGRHPVDRPGARDRRAQGRPGVAAGRCPGVGDRRSPFPRWRGRSWSASSSAACTRRGRCSSWAPAARGALDREQLREVLSTAVGDPTLEVVYRADSPPRWVDGQGRPLGAAGARHGTLPDRGARGRAAGGGPGPRRRPPRGDRLPPGGGVLRAHRAREPAPDRPGGGLRGGGAQVAHPHPGQRRPRAAPDRAGPARRRAAAAGGAGHPARADRGPDPAGS